MSIESAAGGRRAGVSGVGAGLSGAGNGARGQLAGLSSADFSLSATRDLSGARAHALSYAVLADSYLKTPLPRTAYQKVLDQIRPDGTVTRATALQAFAVAYGGLPGVRAPKGPRDTIASGTLAAQWILEYRSRLSAAQPVVVDRRLGLEGASKSARAADLGDPTFHPDSNDCWHRGEELDPGADDMGHIDAPVDAIRALVAAGAHISPDASTAGGVQDKVMNAFDRLLVNYACWGGYRYHGWTGYEDPRTFQGPVVWSERDCDVRFALELEREWPNAGHMEFAIFEMLTL